MKLGQLHTKPSNPYPSGRRYEVWVPGDHGAECVNCSGPMLNHNPAYRYCSDPECQQARRDKWLADGGRPLEQMRHGAYWTYQRGCRCDQCKAAAATMRREVRARRLARQNP